MRQEEILTLKRQGGVPPHNLHAHIPNPNERSRQQSEHAMVTSESTEILLFPFGLSVQEDRQMLLKQK